MSGSPSCTKFSIVGCQVQMYSDGALQMHHSASASDSYSYKTQLHLIHPSKYHTNLSAKTSKEERDSHYLVYKAVYKSIPPLEGKGWMRGPMDVACRWLWTLIPNGSWSEWSQVPAGHVGMLAELRTIKAARELFLLSLTFWTQETGLPVSWLTWQRGLCLCWTKTMHKSRIEEGYR